MKPQFKKIHPVLPVKDVTASIRYYVERLGFMLAFADEKQRPRYAGLRRDQVEIHLQWHSAEEWERMTSSSLRFVVEDVEALFVEYKAQEVFHALTKLKRTEWGTEEFAFYDPSGNGLTFYKDINQ